MRQRRHALAVGQVDIGFCGNNQTNTFGMRRAAITQNDCLKQRGPAKPIDMVHLDIGGQQLLDDRHVTMM